MKLTQISAVRWAASGVFVVGGLGIALQLGTDLSPVAGWAALAVLGAIVAFPLWSDHIAQRNAQAAQDRFAAGPGRFTAEEAPEMRAGPERFAAVPAPENDHRGGQADPEAGLPPWESPS